MSNIFFEKKVIWVYGWKPVIATKNSSVGACDAEKSFARIK